MTWHRPVQFDDGIIVPIKTRVTRNGPTHWSDQETVNEHFSDLLQLKDQISKKYQSKPDQIQLNRQV